MKTITFYSYKGGVGRSLALANIATRLVEFNKKVCLLDFDLEAPGLPFKFPNPLINSGIQKGIVDYIYQFSNEGILPKTILDYSTSFKISNNKKPIHLIPAGNISTNDYWKKLSSINWYELLYENNNGLSFFLDLKEKIRKEINPDFLLIDSRTGISEISGIGISLLADEVVIVAANNKENIEGAKKILYSLNNREKFILNNPPKISFVLSRIPFTDIPEDRAKEQYLISKIKRDFGLIYTDEIVVLHSDRELEEAESLKIGRISDDGKYTITNDYLKLFEKLTRNDLTEAEITYFYKVKEANQLFSIAIKEENTLKRIELLSKAISLDKGNIDYYISRGYSYQKNWEYQQAISDFKFVLSINENNIVALDNISYLYYRTKNYEQALYYTEKQIKLTPNQTAGYILRGMIYSKIGKKEEELNDYQKVLELDPFNAMAYNNLSNYYKNEKSYEKAVELVYKSLEIDPQNGMYYATLAEIYALQNKRNEFFLNFELALMNNKDNDVEEAFVEEPLVYKSFISDKRFINLLEKYSIAMPKEIMMS